jgi:MSHA biogenesis protein MshP
MRFARQNGFTIVSAIFILVVMAALAAFIVTASTGQQIGSALDVQGARAYQAARAGLEWGLFELQTSSQYQFGFGPSPVGANTSATANANSRNCPAASATFNPPASTLAGFTVTVTCTAYVDPNAGPTVFVIQSTASSGTVGSAGYVERRLKVSI